MFSNKLASVFLLFWFFDLTPHKHTFSIFFLLHLLHLIQIVVNVSVVTPYIFKWIELVSQELQSENNSSSSFPHPPFEFQQYIYIQSMPRAARIVWMKSSAPSTKFSNSHFMLLTELKCFCIHTEWHGRDINFYFIYIKVQAITTVDIHRKLLFYYYCCYFWTHFDVLLCIYFL